MITPDTIVVAAKDQASSDLDGEAVILGYRSGTYYGLDAVGTRIWDLVQTPVSVRVLCRLLTAEYDVEPERCRREVLALLEEMREHGLVETQPVP